MKTIQISVNDKDFSKLKEFLSKLKFIKIIKEEKQFIPDTVTLLSEQSLAEDWESKEDERYEKYFKK